MDDVTPESIDDDGLLDPGFDDFDGWSGLPDWLPSRPDDGLYWDLVQ